MFIAFKLSDNTIDVNSVGTDLCNSNHNHDTPCASLACSFVHSF